MYAIYYTYHISYIHNILYTYIRYTRMCTPRHEESQKKKQMHKHCTNSSPFILFFYFFFPTITPQTSWQTWQHLRVCKIFVFLKKKTQRKKNLTALAGDSSCGWQLLRVRIFFFSLPHVCSERISEQHMTRVSSVWPLVQCDR